MMKTDYSEITMSAYMNLAKASKGASEILEKRKP